MCCGATTRYNAISFYPSMEVITAMKYTDGVEYDLNTIKVKFCPQCSNEDFSETSLFCRICGLDLFNNCIRDEEIDINIYKTVYNQPVNPSNARFCEVCGKETIYFKKGILINYQKYQEDKDTEDQIEARKGPQYQEVTVLDTSESYPDFGNELPFN